MQSTSQVGGSNFPSKEEEENEDTHFFLFSEWHKLSLYFCGQEPAEPSNHTCLLLAPSQNWTFAAFSPGLEESFLIPCNYFLSKSSFHQYSHLKFSWNVQTSVCGERPFAARSETTGWSPVSGRVCCERGTHSTAQAKKRQPSSSGPSAFPWTPLLSLPPLSCSVPAGGVKGWHVPSLHRN